VRLRKGTDMASSEQYFTRSEAATLCGCDVSTIIRRGRDGQLPGARQRDDPNGTWEYPLTRRISARRRRALVRNDVRRVRRARREAACQ
jgi:hypothetical protein